MNVLEVRPRLHDPSEIGVRPYWVAEFRIDGRRLIDVVRDVERPFARRDGQPSGTYLALPARMAYLPSRHLLGSPTESYQAEGRASLASCICTDISCWPLYACVTVLADRVIWGDFENPWRGGLKWMTPETRWHYEELGPFVFDRTQYERALIPPPDLPPEAWSSKWEGS